MPKFKIVKRNVPEAKTAQPGSTRTGAKVEKVKDGRRATSAAGRFTGRTTGLSIAKFQNKTIEDNRKKRLSDAALVRVWKQEFPNAKSDYTESIVKGVRGLYNRGKHGNDAPRIPVPEYDDAGQALPFRGEKAAAAREAREAREPRQVKEQSKGKKVVTKGRR